MNHSGGPVAGRDHPRDRIIPNDMGEQCRELASASLWRTSSIVHSSAILRFYLIA